MRDLSGKSFFKFTSSRNGKVAVLVVLVLAWEWEVEYIVTSFSSSKWLDIRAKNFNGFCYMATYLD